MASSNETSFPTPKLYTVQPKLPPLPPLPAWEEEDDWGLPTGADEDEVIDHAIQDELDLEQEEYLRDVEMCRALEEQLAGCPFDDETCRRAAQGGHLETLKWLRANGCPWDGRTCAYAALRGYRRVVEWARANGCPWSEETCPLNAVYRVLCDGRGAFSLFPQPRADSVSNAKKKIRRIATSTRRRAARARPTSSALSAGDFRWRR